ncbi:hypothetical protein MIMGU_mgv1a003148mg [Erythranthe guttata]|uniref:Uncharacterized protein n=1 Tax=Erythranthe guttata TaxID=4155 RepID=A0A022R6Q4_ERYGU|nr:hypothetical protein MIMGU_mgv1a003148mg [Erythranthe guttata]
MICHANELDLTLPFDQDLLDSMTRIRDSEINSERNQNLEYFAEGLGESFNWDNILTHQRSNGSLFNSPATTAAAVIHGQDNKCFEYLQSLLIIFKAWVPNTYPLDIYTRLCLIDIIQGLGIGRYFQSEFYSILEETYRLWQLKEEEIFADISCCAMAFRLLRSRGFEVSSDALAPYAEKDHVSLQTAGVGTILELYRASHIRINEEETTLEAINDWTTTFLKEQLLSKTILDKKLEKQVEYELKNFHGILERVGNRQMIELYDVDNYQIRKTAYRCPTIYNKDFLVFSRQDFNVGQAQNQKELQEFERWYVDCRLDTLKYARDVKNICHFLASSIFADPQLSDARLSYAKTILLVLCADDFFDHYGSREQSYEILQLVKEWNEKSDVVYGSKEVEIIFKAVYRTVNDYAEKAYVEQGRCVKHHLINLWVELLTCFMKELDSWWDEATMNLDEYLSFSRVTIGAKICTLTSIHFIGVRLSDDMILSQECTSMCMHVGIVDRLLNDIQTFKREEKERKLNGMSILKEVHKDEEIAVSEMRKVVEYNRRKLFKIGYQRGTILPKECKDVFLETCKMGYYVYCSGDEFTSPRQMMDDMSSLIHLPLKVI